MAEPSADRKQFPEGMEPLGKSTFRFACHPDVPCFMACCRRLALILYPYDIVQLKNRLGMHSADFLSAHTRLEQGDNPYFPTIFLKMADNQEHTCPFLYDQGCTVYTDRSTACRTYPLERAIDRHPRPGEPREYYFMTNHPYCQGHAEERSWTVKEWLRDQRLLYYNKMNDLWAPVDALFRTNPWRGEGAYGPKQQLAFMVCYNIDGFRSYALETGLFRQFKLSANEEQALVTDDESLLKFGFDWLRYFLAGEPVLQPRRR